MVNRRQEERSLPERPLPLTVEDLGRKVFTYARSNDVFSYRGLFINGSEARNLLGNLANEFLEKRNPQRLAQSLQTLKDEIPNSAIYVGLGTKEGTKLIIRI